MGAVEILIVWENLEIMRYVLKNHQSDGKTWCIIIIYESVITHETLKVVGNTKCEEKKCSQFIVHSIGVPLATYAKK